MSAFPLAFGAPYILLALIGLPLIWWLLKLTPPRPQMEIFPPLRILARLVKPQETPANSPWWLTLIRLAMAAAVIFAMAQPIWNPSKTGISGDGPLLLVIDDGWASGNFWESEKKTALELVSEAERQNRAVLLAFSASNKPAREEELSGLLSADQAAEILEGKNNQPLRVDHADTAEHVSKLISRFSPATAYWLSDGIAREASDILANKLYSELPGTTIVLPDGERVLALGEIANDPEMLRGKLTRLDGTKQLSVSVAAYDKNGVSIARNTANFEVNETDTDFEISGPVEMRNQISRIAIEKSSNAGSVKLLDENFRRRLVGLISGTTFDQTQPLLSPLHYVSRALEPFSDLRRANGSNIIQSIDELINQGVSTIVLADIGNINEDATQKLEDWIVKGGVLLRFAGPRMAGSELKNLLPVELRPGDRNLGGALTWETPKPLAAFSPKSPFFGLEKPDDVIVKRQVLALKSMDLGEKTWAELEDGTPLVTFEQRGAGRIVLFHTSAGSQWSNLPLSGTFVEMLRRVVSLSSSGIKADTEEGLRLPPLSVLDGQGHMVAPTITAEPLMVTRGTLPKPSHKNPPGQYGAEDGYVALNLFDKSPQLRPLSQALAGININKQTYSGETQIDLVPWLLVLAVVLLLADCLAVLWIGGALSLRRKASLKASLKASMTTSASIISALILTASLTLASSNNPSYAQEETSNTEQTSRTNENKDIDYSATLITKLGFIKTGITELDQTSQAGLEGLTNFLTTRTSLEPGPPVALDVETDELNFYPLIYWPIDVAAPMPSTNAMARIDTYMKQGGSILFDTRDQLYASRNGNSNTAEARYLQELLGNLNIPPLEPVPDDHVMTKSFYLLNTFPGRYSGGNLWVEAAQPSDENKNRPVRAGDGVSAIIITSNDLAGAWAITESNTPLFSTVPPDPAQREYAFRTGVNLVMYTLTGNYKADQVHIPALLERLGQ